jgi:hypothetical protein
MGCISQVSILLLIYIMIPISLMNFVRTGFIVQLEGVTKRAKAMRKKVHELRNHNTLLEKQVCCRHEEKIYHYWHHYLQTLRFN